ncbi:substrate-binding domain-containing protein, partial [Klenkia sp. PcliD-1-E]
MVLATVLALVAAVWVVTRPSAEDTAAAGDGGCRVEDTVRVTVAPGLGALVRGVLAGPIPVGGGDCTIAEVRTEEPLQTLGVLTGTDLARQPQVWVPDDGTWATRAGSGVTPTGAQLARTPVVLATSRAVAEAQGWTGTAPSWADVPGAPTGAVLPDPVAEPAGLLALAALSTAAGEGDAGDA